MKKRNLRIGLFCPLSLAVCGLCAFIFPGRTGFGQGGSTDAKAAPNVESADGKFLSLTPDFSKGTLDNGRGMLPFIVKNNSTEDIIFMQDWNEVVNLMTVDDSGKKVTIRDFSDPNGGRSYSGPGPRPVVLKPGESGTYESQFAMETLAFAAGKNKKIFGEIPGHTLGTNQPFTAESAAFVVPPELARPPWDDLGKQGYLAVTVDAANPEFNVSGARGAPGAQYWAFLMFPIKITNTTTQPFLINSIHASFCRSEGDPKPDQDLWELAEGMPPIPDTNHHSKDIKLLKPGESVKAGGRTYITLWNNRLDEWKKGDALVVRVVGRIPGTNKVFECYSAPFEFPALPQ